MGAVPLALPPSALGIRNVNYDCNNARKRRAAPTMWFKPKSVSSDALLAIVELKRELKSLSIDTPAASFIFNNTILGIRNVAPKTDLKRLIAALEDSIMTEGHTSAAVDGGTTVLAQRFAIAYLRLPSGIVGAATYKASFDDAANAGSKYRDLDERDEMPPGDATSAAILNAEGHTCFADVVKTLRIEQEREGYSEVEFTSLVQALLASFDIRTEASSGKLAPHLDRLTGIIRRL